MEVLLVLGSKCNFRCSYCYTQLKEKPFRDDINVFESNLDKVFEHIDWHLERYPSVTLTEFGGEPLIYIDVWEKLINRYVGNPKIRWNFITNGMLLPKCWDILRVIPKNKLSMSISYDYSLQDETRQAGTYEPVREIIKEYSTFFTKGSGEKAFNFFFCDDIGNDFDVAMDAGCRFVMFLKNVYSNQISFKDFVCSGHVSPAFIDTYARVASPGVFRHEKGKLEYLTIDFSDEIEMQIYTDIDTEDYKPRSADQNMGCLI